MRVVGYLDDGILGNYNKDITERMCFTVRFDLTAARLTINEDKSMLLQQQDRKVQFEILLSGFRRRERLLLQLEVRI